MKTAKSPEKLAELKSERDDLSVEIKVIRKDLFLLDCVRKEREEIKRKIIAQRELESRRHEAEKIKTKNIMKGRGHER